LEVRAILLPADMDVKGLSAAGRKYLRSFLNMLPLQGLECFCAADLSKGALITTRGEGRQIQSKLGESENDLRKLGAR
jgi:hypothetical protein